MGGGDNLVFGDDGDDTTSGGLGGFSVVSGGAGNDKFLLSNGTGSVVQGNTGNDNILVLSDAHDAIYGGQGDRIMNWRGNDSLAFVSIGPGTARNYIEFTEDDFVQAKAIANMVFDADYDYVVVQIGENTMVFADTGNDNGVAEDVIVLVGAGLDSISSSDII